MMKLQKPANRTRKREVEFQVPIITHANAKAIMHQRSNVGCRETIFQEILLFHPLMFFLKLCPIFPTIMLTSIHKVRK